MITYTLAEDAVRALVQGAMQKWHPELAYMEVKLGILMADNSDIDKPAVRHAGYAALATVRIVPLRDRLTKGYDAEMLLSARDWDAMKEPLRLALVDHELSHIRLKKKKNKRTGAELMQRDDLGRPQLQLVKADWNAGDGFKEVVARHGENAAEFENIRRAYAYAQAAKEGEI